MEGASLVPHNERIDADDQVGLGCKSSFSYLARFVFGFVWPPFRDRLNETSRSFLHYVVHGTLDSAPCLAVSITKIKGNAMPEYWVYENWTHKRARMHVAECSFCNKGRGFQPEDSGRNGRWIGPFSDREAASLALQNTGLADRNICPVCSP